MRYITILILLFLHMVVYCQKPEGYDKELEAMLENSIELINSDELSKIINTRQNFYILDTREAAEYKVSHIDGAKNVGYSQFSLKSVSDIPKDAEIVVYCSLGVRSEKIGERLKNAGYTNVKNLYGGIFEWMYWDKPIVDKKGHHTEKVHTYDENWSKWLLKGEKVY